MKYIILAMLAIGCKDSTTVNHNYPGSDTSSQAESLAGMHYLEDNGVLEIIKQDNGNYIIYGTQRVITKNADSTLTLFPSLPATAQTAFNGKLAGYQSMTYAAGNNVKTTGNVVIAAARLTYFEISKVDGRLKVKLKVLGTNNTTVEHESEAKEL